MLKKENRFATPFLNKPNSFSAPLFSLKFIDSEESKKRFSFIVSKKVDKRSVARNRLKRVFSASIYDLLDKIKDIDAVFYIKKEAIGKGKKEVIENIEESFKMNKLIK